MGLAVFPRTNLCRSRDAGRAPSLPGKEKDTCQQSWLPGEYYIGISVFSVQEKLRHDRKTFSLNKTKASVEGTVCPTQGSSIAV